MYDFYLTKRVLLPPSSGIRKLLLIMKLTTLILITVILHVSATVIAQKVTLNEKNARLVDVFDDINAQTGYNFAFTTTTLQNSKPVTINVKNEELSDVLVQIFQGQNLDFSIENKSVVVKPKEESLLDKLKNGIKAELAAVTVSGKVRDETGQPLVGVTVRIKNTNIATATDAKGLYTLTVPDDKSTITFSFVGFETQEFSASDIPNGTTITLKASTTNLREVVLNQGYYTRKQELQTGNITRVSGEDIAKQPGIDPIAALEGRVPGLYIQQTSGIPGANETVRLRGQNSLKNGNDPLYLIDGVPFAATSLTSKSITGGAVGQPTLNNGNNIAGGLSPFSILDPSNIESIEVLKDADATSIYGSRGANGVILITTKRGKPGKTVVDINASQGAARVASELNLMNTQQYLAMRRQAFTNDGLTVPDIKTSPNDNNFDINGVWDQNRYTDWQKVFIGGTAQYTNLRGTISGGTANTQFIFGGNYNRQTTVFPGQYLDQKGSAHFNLTHSSTDEKFHTTFSAQYGYDKNIIPLADFTGSILLAPDAPPLYNSDGSINWAYTPSGTPSFFNNPIRATVNTASSATQSLISNLALSYEILPGLKLKSSIGYTRREMNQTNLTLGASTFNPNPFSRSNNLATTTTSTLIFEPQIDYQKTVGKSKFDALIGMTQQQDQYNGVGYNTLGFVNDALVPNPSFATLFLLAGNHVVTDYRYAAIYGRLGYNLEDKYLLNLTARRDGSSRFGPAREFGNFGAVGAGWIFSKEEFARSISWLSLGKLRASYGITGNDQIGDYQYLSTYSAYNKSYQGVSTLYPTGLSNPNYGWEVNKKLEVGLDLNFIKDRINLSADYFRNRSGNQLVGYSLPNTTGFSNVIANLPAVVQNTGLELYLQTINFKGKSFSWTTSLNLTVPRNKLVSYPGLAQSFNATQYAIGMPIGTQFVLHYTGVNPQTGLYTVQDVNGDGVLDNSDMHFFPSLGQSYFGGINNSFSYKGLQLDIFFQFVKQIGVNYLGSFSVPGINNSNMGNLPVAFLNAWTSPGKVSSIQKLTSSGGSAAGDAVYYFTSSDGMFTDASFIRLKNVQLSYRLPLTWQQRMHVQSFRVFVQGQNLLTITKYKGLDPENQDATSLPPLRLINAGVEIGL